MSLCFVALDLGSPGRLALTFVLSPVVLAQSDPPAGTPTVAISANPTSISSGKISTVTWSSSNALACTAGGGWTGTKATSGTLAVSPTGTTTYTLTCIGAQRFVLSSQYDGGCECQPGAGQRRVRICKRHASIVCTFEQPLLDGHVVERGGFGPVDMELWRFERRYQR